MGLSNGFGSIAGIFIPLVKDWIVGSPPSCEELIRRFDKHTLPSFKRL